MNRWWDLTVKYHIRMNEDYRISRQQELIKYSFPTLYPDKFRKINFPNRNPPHFWIASAFAACCHKTWPSAGCRLIASDKKKKKSHMCLTASGQSVTTPVNPGRG